MTEVQAPVSVAAPGGALERLCCICLSDVNVALLVLVSMDGCKHEPSVCRECARHHVEVQVVDKKGGSNAITCPCIGCGAEVSAADVTRLTNARLQAEYDRLRTLDFVRSLPLFRWCSRPDCGSGQEHITGDEEPIMTCHECQHKTCFTHRSEWHSGLTCEEFTRQLQENGNAALENFLDSSTKPCPRCNEPIEKNGGCDHMTCRPPGGCGYEFCWLCLADYNTIRREGNHMHKDTCMHFRPVEEVD